MKRLGVVLVGGMMVFGQGTALPQDAAKSAGPCLTCGRWESYQQFNTRRFERAFINSLDHEVDGVVESAIREVALIKMAQPLWESSRVVGVLHELATGDRALTIRIKASLAEAVFSEKLEFRDAGFRTDEEVFSAIVQELHRQRYANANREASSTIAGR